MSVVEPHRIWVIMADAATQKNFELPRLQHNRCKDLQNVPWYGMKLMATYAPGFGFSPYLVHDSMFSGANVLWSVVWLTLCSMRDEEQGGCLAGGVEACREGVARQVVELVDVDAVALVVHDVEEEALRLEIGPEVGRPRLPSPRPLTRAATKRSRVSGSLSLK